MKCEIRTRPVFRKIMYAQAWEDPAADLRALSIGPGDDVFAIGASGDNALAFLIQGARSVTAIDFNLSQCALIELKLAAFATLSWSEVVELVGARPSGRRDRLYARLREALSHEARGFWDAHADLIRRGVMHVGRFENMFRIFRWTILPLVCSADVVRRMLDARSVEEQRRIYREEWDSWRWRGLFRLFFNETIIGALGRDPAMFKYVPRGDVAGVFLERTRHVFEDLPVRGNWFVRYILTGDYGPDERLLPPYLLEENHPKIRAALDRVTIVNDTLEDYLPSVPEGRFSKFYLSDVLEYVPEDAAEHLLRALWRAGREGGVLSYRNLLAPRARPGSMADMLEPDEELARRCNFEDRSFVYTRHVVERIRKARLPAAAALA